MDGGTQPRAELDQELIDDYAEQMSEGVTFPPVVLFYDGKNHWLADGFHRTESAVKVGFLDIEADVRQGTRRDAILFSVGANATQLGKPRSRGDKRRAVETMLTNDEVMIDPKTERPWSNRDVARWCNVHHSFVAKVKENLSGYIARCDDGVHTVERNGTVYPMNTSRIGHARDHPDVTPEQAAINGEICGEDNVN